MEPGVDAGIRNKLGNKTARHDAALVHKKGHALQPSFLRQVGRWLARGDAGLNQLLHGLRLVFRHRQRRCGV